MNRSAYGRYQMVLGTTVLIIGIGALIGLGTDARFLILGLIMVATGLAVILVGYRRSKS